MDRNACIKRMKAHFERPSDGRALIVNVQNFDDLNEIKAEFCATQVKVLSISSICKLDFLPQHEVVIELLKSQTKPVLLTELATVWKFYGGEALRRILGYILGENYAYPLIVLAYQSVDLLKEMIKEDVRRREQILWVENRATRLPTIVLVNAKIGACCTPDRMVSGIDKVAKELESWQIVCAPGESNLCVDAGRLHVFTRYGKQQLPHALYALESICDAYDMLKELDSRVAKLKCEMGTSEQWDWLLNLMLEHRSIRVLVDAVLKCKPETIEFGLRDYERWEDHERWLYYLACHLWKPQHNSYMLQAFRRCTRYDKLLESLYRTLAMTCDIKARMIDDESYDHQIFWQEFWKRYDQRRKCLEYLGSNFSQEAMEYCQWIECQKEQLAHYYLTNLTESERQTMLKLFEKRPGIANKAKLEEVLDIIYPQLSQYLRSCDFNAEGVDADVLKETKDYIDKYKYYKLVNHIEPSFIDRVNTEAKERSFNRYPKRDAEIEKICHRAQQEATEAWLVDALGVEFLNYIREKCSRLKLDIQLSVHRANIPTLTKCNYTLEFRHRLEEAGVQIYDNKDIDEGKHEAATDYQCVKTRLPVHLFAELRSLDAIIEKIDHHLRFTKSRCAVIIPDHGASRLAVLADAEVVDVGSQGEHGGRICVCCPEMEKLPDAICSEDGQHYVMAGYRRFKGGRKPVVEVHGGALLEEVLVPVIEIRRPGMKIEVTLPEREIKVDYKTYAVLRFNVPKGLSNARILLRNTWYDAHGDGQHFEVHTGINKAGEHQFDVYEGDKLVAQNLSFKTVSRGIQSRDEDFF